MSAEAKGAAGEGIRALREDMARLRNVLAQFQPNFGEKLFYAVGE
jgi:hypothetical protein